MSDTPRTDVLLIAHDMAPTHISLISHARELERELNAANDRIKRLEEAGDKIVESGWSVQDWSGMCVVWAKAKEDKL